MKVVSDSVLRATSKQSVSLLIWLKKYWYWVLIVAVLLPSAIGSVREAVETKNPTLPLFQVATRVFAADGFLQGDVNMLEEDPALIIGMDKPTSGIWVWVVYYWKVVGVAWRIIGNVWLIFFPLRIIYMIVHKGGDRSMNAKNMLKSSWYFLLYLFITNTIIFMHGLIKGNVMVELPVGVDTFYEYWLLFIHILPFHGLVSLCRYVFLWVGGV